MPEQDVTSNQIFSTVALIPARGDSKGIPGKNIRSLAGHPLISYTVRACQLSQRIERIIVSTDSPEIADIATAYGAEVPFLRPPEFSRDDSTDIEYIQHALSWFTEGGRQVPNFMIQMRPTTPLRNPRLIDQAIQKLIDSPGATALRSAHELAEPPQKMLRISDEFFDGFFPDEPRPDYYNLPRQAFPPAYHPNGYVDIVIPKTIASCGSLYGPRILPMITPYSVEVDSHGDWEYLEYLMSKSDHLLRKSLAEET